MPAKYKIHPGIGIARLGNSPDGFYLAPETPAAVPTACDAQGNPILYPDGQSEEPVKTYKDAQGRIKRQAARFQVYVYDDESPEGRPLELGDPVEGGGNEGVLVDIQWRVYLANKKSSWYAFEQLEGEHGYASDHPRRNAAVTDDEARQRLIIDPGPQLVNCSDRRNAAMSRDGSDRYAPTFPPSLSPNDIDTLGDLKTDDVGRLLVLSGHGNSGSYLQSDFGEPLISDYANNDGWFDDTADGPVMARLVMYSENVTQRRFVDVEYPAWCVVGYPSYVPEVLDMVTMDDVVYDLGVRQFATRTDLFGKPGTFDDPPHIPPTDTEALIHWRAGSLEWNADFKPWFYRDIWPILFRADEFSYLTNVLAQSNFPHNQTPRGNFDPSKLGVPPVVNQRALTAGEQRCIQQNEAGDLFLQALDAQLTLIHNEATASLRVLLSQFDESIRTLVDGYRARGERITPEDFQKYQTWLRKTRENYADRLGDLLFDELRAAVPPPKDAPKKSDKATRSAKSTTAKSSSAKSSSAKSTSAQPSSARQLLQDFAQTIDAEHKSKKKGTQLRAAPTLGEDEPATVDFWTYAQDWKARYADPDEDYRDARDALEKGLDAFLDALLKKAQKAWVDEVNKTHTLLKSWGPDFVERLNALKLFAVNKQAPDAPILAALFKRLDGLIDRQIGAYLSGRLLDRCQAQCVARCTHDPFRKQRLYLHALLRQPGEENDFRLSGQPNNRVFSLPLMPLLAGDNPISNTLPSKFLRLTDYQLFLLRQWKNGLFINEGMEGWPHPDPYQPYADWKNTTARKLDQGVLTNVLGGAFCPGGEVGWVMRNTAIFHEPYRVKADPDFYTFRLTAAQSNNWRGQVPDEDYVSYVGITLSPDNDFDRGLQPGDLTKYMALPWQADFNECTMQDIDITYEGWNDLYPESDKDSLLKREQKVWETLWWPAHRPVQVMELVGMQNGSPILEWLSWSRGIPQTNMGDQKMVTAWHQLSFVIRNPFVPTASLDTPSPNAKYIGVERNPEAQS